MNALSAALTIAALSLGQAGSGSIAGSWTAGFEGRTFIRLELETVNGAIAGGISLGNFEVDQHGVVRRADAAPPNLTPIFDVTLKESTVTFFTKAQNDTDQFEIRLIDHENAELHFLLNDEDRRNLADSGVLPPKPIRLTRVG